MKFKKGQIVQYDFPKNDKKKTGVLYGFHMAVVLHSRETPFKTMLIAPITSAEGLKNKCVIPDNYVSLDQSNYAGILGHDSFINLDMIVAVDEKEINDLEKYAKKITKFLEPSDMELLDFKIAFTYELQAYVNSQVEKEVENIVEYIDKPIKDKVKEVLDFIKDENIKDKLMYIIENDLIGVLKSTYLTETKS